MKGVQFQKSLIWKKGDLKDPPPNFWFELNSQQAFISNPIKGSNSLGQGAKIDVTQWQIDQS